jgi:hypothetical protein
MDPLLARQRERLIELQQVQVVLTDRSRVGRRG